jgi:hypothetical protein
LYPRVVLREFEDLEVNTASILGVKDKPRKKLEAAGGKIRLSLPQSGHSVFK